VSARALMPKSLPVFGLIGAVPVPGDGVRVQNLSPDH
jgi:hypothetical protein